MGYLESLDPRINRLHIPDNFGTPFAEKEGKEQFVTYEVFVKAQQNKPYQHEGIVHAPSPDMAFLFAKEQYSRRGNTCFGIWIVKTRDIKVTPYSDNQESIYEYIHADMITEEPQDTTTYEVFQQFKRGKQHQHAGSVEARSYEEAMVKAKEQLQPDKPVLNLWLVKADQVARLDDDFQDIWETLPEKTYREAIDYKAMDKIKKFKEENKQTHG